MSRGFVLVLPFKFFLSIALSFFYWYSTTKSKARLNYLFAIYKTTTEEDEYTAPATYVAVILGPFKLTFGFFHEDTGS